MERPGLKQICKNCLYYRLSYKTSKCTVNRKDKKTTQKGTCEKWEAKN